GQRGDSVARGGGTGVAQSKSMYRGSQGLDPAMIKQIETQFGFDKPASERYVTMLKNFATFDLGESFYRSQGVLSLIAEKLPVSISLGLWSLLIIYAASIPLGIRKAVHDGSRFDVATSTAIFVGYAVPGFLFAIMLIVLFAGGRYYDWFPLRGLVSENWNTLSWPNKIRDYLWHMVLPVTALTIGGFAQLTMLTKNTFLEEINKQYVVTARAKGVGENGVLYGHVFRNAMLIVIAGFPATLIATLFTGALLIEVMFSLDGLGLLSFEAVINRDYPVVFGSLYIFSLIGLLLNVATDIAYHMVDPRIDFESRGRG
ncbi:MAG: microcin C ABC transporter permease YejB, partial [Rhodospirillaceae bacterium]|nr:microcin C ABC transporter permease YejB [Rhodospirillaceae bacterium]